MLVCRICPRLTQFGGIVGYKVLGFNERIHSYLVGVLTVRLCGYWFLFCSLCCQKCYFCVDVSYLREFCCYAIEEKVHIVKETQKSRMIETSKRYGFPNVFLEVLRTSLLFVFINCKQKSSVTVQAASWMTR